MVTNSTPFGVGLFQLLPRPAGVSDGETIARALREADDAEALGFDSVWVAEHHLSEFGLGSAPLLYLAALSQRTRRVALGTAVAVLPLHDPIRLAEEIAWVDHLSGGRLRVGVGPGFSAFELGAFGVPHGERHVRAGAVLDELFRRLSGKAPLAPRPRHGAPPILRACSSVEGARRAASERTGVLLGLKPLAELSPVVAAYREAGGAGEIHVLRRVVLSDRTEEAEDAGRRALAWEDDVARRVHGAEPGASATLFGTPDDALEELRALAALGVTGALVWTTFGSLPEESARRTAELLASRVLPELRSPAPGLSSAA